MKKTIFYLFVTLLFGSLVLVSCEPKPDDDTNKEQTEQPKFCVYCGAKLTGPFCSSCGHKVKE